MSFEHEEKLIDELIRKVKTGRDVSAWKNEKSVSPLLGLIKALNSVPAKPIEQPNYDRVRSQIMQRINRSSDSLQKTGFWTSLRRSVPMALKYGSAAFASVIIFISLAIGTAAASLESLPGQPLYPLKTVVEKVQLKLATDETQRANLQIKFANNRLDELEKVLEKNKQGKISGEQVQQIVSKTVKDLESTNSAITQSPAPSSDKPVAILSKLVDLNNKQTTLLQTASVQSEGEVKIELEKALAATQITKEKAIENIERAGLQVEENPVTIEDPSALSPDAVTASGKLTSVSADSVSIGTAKFLVTKDTKFVNISAEELKVGVVVDISGKIENNRTYATQITLKTDVKSDPDSTESQTPASENQQPAY